jgi:hypothetical protein
VHGKDRSGFHGTTIQAAWTKLWFFSVSFRIWKESLKTWEIYMYIIFLYQIFQKTASWQFLLETFPCKGFITIKLQYQVVVGDRKSYDHLIKLKSEYGGSLSWVLPYPGDWHILFFNLIFY